MANGEFQRNGHPENSTWKTNQDYFRGWTRATLEDIKEDITDMKKSVRKNKDSINSMRLQSVMFGGVAGGVTVFLLGLL